MRDNDRLARAIAAQFMIEHGMSEAAAALGRKGGQAGKGASKVRGDSAYYKALRAKHKPKPPKA